MKCGAGVPVSFEANMPEILHEFDCSPIYWRNLCEMGYTVSFGNKDIFTEKFVEEIVLGKLWEDNCEENKKEKD